MKKKFAIFFLFVFVVICALIFRPVPIVNEAEANAVSGVMSTLKLTEGNDFVFTLKNDPTRYYINRGIENGLDYDAFEKALLGKEVLVKYPSYWTPLDWNNQVRHISKIEHNKVVYFNEFKDKELLEKKGN